MVVGNNESTATKNAGKSMAILIAMALQRYDAVFSPPCWRHGMARMAIRVSGQRQKHGDLLLGEIAKWLLRFSGDHHLTTPDTSLPADPVPPPPEPSSAAVATTVATADAVVVVAAISAITIMIMPLAVVTTVVLVSLLPPPPPPSLPLPLLVDCCLLFGRRCCCRR
jgi:hypothetical protein